MDYTMPWSQKSTLVQIFCLEVINKLMQGLYTIWLKLHITETIPCAVGGTLLKSDKNYNNNYYQNQCCLFCFCLFVCSLFIMYFHQQEFIVYMKSQSQCNTVVCAIFTFYDRVIIQRKLYMVQTTSLMLPKKWMFPYNICFLQFYN